MNTIGRNIPRIGAWERVVGAARFASDFASEEMLTLMVLRSDRHHALIKRIDATHAYDIPGYVRVFTHKDIPGVNRFGIITKDQTLLAEEKVRCIGDAVCLVAAESREAAEKALKAIKIVYEDLPAVFDPEEALRNGAPKIHAKGNELGRRVIHKGNPAKAFERADVVIERVYKTHHLEHAYLEPDAGIGYLDENGILAIIASTQNPHYDRKEVSELLGLEEKRVRIIQAATGGGFGSKLDLNVQGFVGMATLLLGKPTKMIYSREEAFLATAKRHPLKIYYKSGADREGRICAVDVKIIGDTGAYASYGLAVVSRSAVHATGPYEVPNVHIESIFAYTNNPYSGAMRGFGVPQMAFAHESQMDLIAKALALDPVEIRRRNCLRVGSLTSTGQLLDASVGIGATLDAVAHRYRNLSAEKRPSRPHKRRGVGIGSMMYGIGNTGIQNPSTAHVELTTEGKIKLFTGAADIGQGSSTVLTQIAAEILGQNVHAIDLISADTQFTTSAGATSASRQTYISGNAVRDAAEKLKDIMLVQASSILRIDRSELVPDNGVVRSQSDPKRSVSLKQLADYSLKNGIPLKWQGFFDPPTTPLDPKTGQGVPYATYAFASHVAEVEVDTFTGEVEVIRIVAAHDVGKAINPENVRGQILGGVAMGLGFAIMEEFVPNSTESLKDYHIPTFSDTPTVESIIVEDEEPTGPYGAKGVGEPALIPTAPAILNAVADALGTRIYELPASLEVVLKAAMVKSEPIIDVEQQRRI